MGPCCRRPGNRERVEVRTVDDPAALARRPWIVQQFVAWGWLRMPQQPYTLHERCRVCGRNHYRLYARTGFQPGRFSVR